MLLKTLPSQAYLLQRLRYDPDTGQLWWKCYEGATPQWNGKFAGRLALTAPIHGYRHGNIDNTKYSAHRVIWKMVTGQDPRFIDHIDGDRSNNVWSNLRNVSSSENGKNKTMLSSNSSGAMGVTFCKQTKKWIAQIHLSGKNIKLGRFDSIQDAKSARLEANKIYGFHENHGKTTA